MSDITLQRGEYAVYVLTITQGSAALDLTGATINFVAVNTGIPAGSVVSDTADFLNKTVGSGITISSATAGECEIEFLSADTSAVEFTTVTRAIEMPFSVECVPAGFPGTLPVMTGNLIITPDYVRAI